MKKKMEELSLDREANLKDTKVDHVIPKVDNGKLKSNLSAAKESLMNYAKDVE